MSNSEFATEAELERSGIAKRQTFSKWRIKGKGPRYYKIHGAVRYRWSDVEAWLADCVRNREAVALAQETVIQELANSLTNDSESSNICPQTMRS